MKILRIIWIFFLFIFFSSCFPEKKPVYKYIDDNKSFCKKASWEVVTRFIDENGDIAVTNSKIWQNSGFYRIEIYNNDMSESQLIIIRDGIFYLFTKDKKIFGYNVNDENVEIFLRKIFVNIGFGKNKKNLLEKDAIYAGEKHDIYQYEFYRNIHGLLCKAKVKEWYNKKNMLIRAETDVYKTEFDLNKQKKIVGPFKEIYEVKNHKCYFVLSSKLFELPDDYEIINFRDYYRQKLIKAGKTPEATDAGIVTFNVKKR